MAQWRKGALSLDLAERIASFAHDPNTSSEELNNLAWQLYSRYIENLDVAERLSREAVNRSPDEYSIQTLAAILIRRNVWPESGLWLKQWLELIDGRRLEAGWSDFRLLFEDAIRWARTDEVMEAASECTGDAYIRAIVSALNTANQNGLHVDWPNE
jgi:hypothetical protein